MDIPPMATDTDTDTDIRPMAMGIGGQWPMAMAIVMAMDITTAMDITGLGAIAAATIAD